MELFFDITTFEPRASDVMKRGLSPLCDHKGFEDGQFCCLDCSVPLFDQDDLFDEGHLFYGFNRPLALSLFYFQFNTTAHFPTISLCCKGCGNLLGTLLHQGKNGAERYHIFSRSVFLAKKLEITSETTRQKEHPLS